MNKAIRFTTLWLFLLYVVFGSAAKQSTAKPEPPADGAPEVLLSGGAQGVPPLPNQVGPNHALNPSFELPKFLDWTTTSSSCLMLDNTVNHTPGGVSSARMTDCGTTTPLQQTVTIGSSEAVVVSFWVRTDAAFSGSLTVSFFDDSHGYGSVLGDTHSETSVGPSSDWVQVQTTLSINSHLHSGDRLNVRINLVSQTGTVWIDDVEMDDTWYPLRTFVTYPNYRGYLWSDKAQTITGVSVVNPPLGIPLNDTELSLNVASTPGCGSGIVLSQVISPSSSPEIHWTLDGTSLATGGTYYLCSSLLQVSDSATLAQYSDWKINKVDASFRSSLVNYFDADGAWVHNGRRRLAFGTYDRLSGTYRCSGCLWSSGRSCSPQQASAQDCYTFNINSMGYSTPRSQVLTRGSSLVADYHANMFDIVMGGITTFSAVNPTQENDQLTPWLDVANSYGFSHAQILNNWYGTLVNQTPVPGAPPPPTLSFVPSGGQIGTPWIFIQIAATTALAGGAQLYTLPSATAQNLSALSGTTNSVQVRLPSCPNSRWLGFYVYAATSATNSLPPVSQFSRQGTARWLGCGSTVTLTQIITSGVTPPTSDTTGSYFRPTWQTAADPQNWTELARTMSNNPGSGAFYIADEPGILSLGTQAYQSSVVASSAQGVPTFGVLVNSTDGSLWRDVLDVIGNDPYGYGIAASPDDVWAGTPRTGRACTAYSGKQNQLGIISNCNVARVDAWSDSLARDSYGSRPQWEVVQQFSRGTENAIPYAEMRRQVYKALIGCQNWGSLGCGVLTWGWVSSVGMERAWFQDGNTQAYGDQVKLGAEVMGMEQVWLSPTLDSAALTVGHVISGVSSSVPAGEACGSASGYNNSADYPYGPVRFITKQMPNGDQWIIATNLCSSPAPFKVTFKLVDPPQAIVSVYGENRTLPIIANQFTDTWQDTDVHAYLISHSASTGLQ